ncbi:hypothetical protein ISCGN_001894 [Ixodes scapularis]
MHVGAPCVRVWWPTRLGFVVTLLTKHLAPKVQAPPAELGVRGDATLQTPAFTSAPCGVVSLGVESCWMRAEDSCCEGPGLGGKHQPIKARSLLFAAHGKCFQVSMAHKPAGASSFSFKVSTAYKQASTSSFFLKALVTNFRQESQHLTKGTAVVYVEEIQDSAAIAVISEDASPTQHKGTTPSELDIDPSLPAPQRRQLTDVLAEFNYMCSQYKGVALQALTTSMSSLLCCRGKFKGSASIDAPPSLAPPVRGGASSGVAQPSGTKTKSTEASSLQPWHYCKNRQLTKKHDPSKAAG